MKNKISAKIVIALLVIIGMMPFSSSQVFADGSGQFNRIFSFENTLNGGFNMYCDYYFGRGNYTLNGTFIIKLNNYGGSTHTLRKDMGDFSWAIIEADGQVGLSTAQITSGTGDTYWEAYQITLTFTNCTYCDFRIVNYSFTNFWTTDRLKNKSGTLGISVVDNTEAYFSTNSQSEFDCLNSIRNSMLSLVSNGLTLDQDAMNLLESIESILSNIDTLIDTISWGEQLTSTTNMSVYADDNTTASTSQFNAQKIKVTLSTTNVYTGPVLLKIEIPVKLISLINGFDYTITTEHLNFNNAYLQMTRNSNIYLYLTQYSNETSSSSKSITINFDKTYTFLPTVNNRIKYQSLSYNDIEAWQLESVINQYNFNKGSSITQNSVDDNDTTIQTVSDQIEDYHDIESDLNTDFNTNLQQLDPTSFETRITGWSNGITWLKNNMDSLYNSFGDFKYLFEFGMILAIALIFIGR